MSTAGNARTYLLDTNVWLDYALPDRPGHRSAFELVDEAVSCGVRLLYAGPTIKDLFFIVGKTLKADARETEGLAEGDAIAINNIAWSVVDAVRRNATAVGMDESDVWIACKYRVLHNDLEDNLVLAAAERARVAFLVTNDEALIRHATVPTLTPEDALAHLRATLG